VCRQIRLAADNGCNCAAVKPIYKSVQRGKKCSGIKLTTILITGVTSCSGRHAVQYLRRKIDIQIHGTARIAADLDGLTDCHQCDFLNPDEIYRVVQHVKPDQVLHLAASSDASNAGALVQTNIAGTLNLLEACQQTNRKVDVLLVGSAAGFGEMRDDETGLAGDRVCKPVSLYGVSRETQLELGRISEGQNGLRILLCRTFNLIGPGISDRYVPMALATRIANALRDGVHELELRDMNSVRDFVDVRDAVAAYFAIMEHGRTGYAYSVGRGEPVTIERLAGILAEEQGGAIRFKSEARKDITSRTGINRSVADSFELQKDTGWSPQFTLAESVRDMLAHDSFQSNRQNTAV